MFFPTTVSEWTCSVGFSMKDIFILVVVFKWTMIVFIDDYSWQN